MAESDPSGRAAEPAKEPGLRFLEAAVYIMGGLLVLMVVALIGGIAWKLAHRPPSAAQPESAVNIALSQGASIAGVTLEGERMAVHVVEGASHEIIIVDIRKGAVVSRVRLVPSP
jgi:hypothetical protein